MKKYYIDYWRDFGNTYNVFYVETTNPIHIKILETMKKAKQITRKEAERKCAEEKRRIVDDANFSGYASVHIFSIDYDIHKDDYVNQTGRFKVSGYMIERI